MNQNLKFLITIFLLKKMLQIGITDHFQLKKKRRNRVINKSSERFQQKWVTLCIHKNL